MEVEKWLNKNAMQKWIRTVRMKDVQAMNPDALKDITRFVTDKKYKFSEPYFLREVLFKDINDERRYLKYIAWLINVIQDIQIKTLIQDLVISKSNQQNKWIYATAEAKSPGLQYRTRIRVSTRVAKGKGPFMASLFIYKKTGTEWTLRFKIPPIRIIPIFEAVNLIPTAPVMENFATAHDFEAAEQEYEDNLREYRAAFTKPVERVVGLVEFFSINPENPEKQFGDLEQGEYRIVMIVRSGDRPDFEKEYNKIKERGPNELWRYGWDRKEATLMIVGGPRQHQARQVQQQPQTQVNFDFGEIEENEQVEAQPRQPPQPPPTQRQLGEVDNDFADMIARQYNR